MNSAIILAGGIGSRFGSDIPKQFIEINNKKIIDYSIQSFKKNKYIHEIILVLHKSWLNKYKDEYQSYKLAEGGNSRSLSSLNGILSCSKKTQNVLIHDAARPLLSQNIIDTCIDNLSYHEATTPFVNIPDSLIIKNEDKVEYLNRDLIKYIQTPQGFKIDIIKDALENSKKFGSDDISTLLNYNPKVNVKFFKGNENNFKVTKNIDIQILKSLLNE